MHMHKILVSACLIGEKVRYDADHKRLNHQLFKLWEKEGRLIPICPEMAGGLPAPRPAAEIVGDKVINVKGDDVTDAFHCGAREALSLCQGHNIKMAILKARSPSCANLQIYDGTHSSRLIDGQGVTVALLSQHGIKVFNEEQLILAANYLTALL